MDVVAFIVACFLFSLSPGSGAAVSVNNAITNGIKGVAFGIAGLQAALALHLVFIYLGIGVLVSQSPTLYNIIKYAGIIYLTYLGIEKIVESMKHSDALFMEGSKKSRLKLMKQGFTVNMTNPKSIIFLAAFLPQFIQEQWSKESEYLLLGGIVVAVDTLVMFFYSFAATSLKQVLSQGRVVRHINFSFGILFIIIAISIALSDYS